MSNNKIITAQIPGPGGREVEFHPAFIVREWGTEEGKRVIMAADLTHISVGFKRKSPLWVRVCWLIARAKRWWRGERL